MFSLIQIHKIAAKGSLMLAKACILYNMHGANDEIIEEESTPINHFITGFIISEIAIYTFKELRLTMLENRKLVDLFANLGSTALIDLLSENWSNICMLTSTNLANQGGSLPNTDIHIPKFCNIQDSSFELQQL